MTDLHELGLADAVGAMRGGKLSPIDYVDALLKRIEKHDPHLHATLDVSAKGALSAARNLTKRHAEKDHLPLFGIPFLVKGNIDVKGKVTSCQSQANSGEPAQEDATCVRSLLDAGAILLGTTALDEFALGKPCETDPWPAPKNPWNPLYTAGGSSSGSGASLAAGFAPLTLGTDTGGSIRSPASMNGVVGLKPGFGSISMQGVFPLALSMDTVGPMTRSVQDLGVVFSTLSAAGTKASTISPEKPRIALADTFWRNSPLLSTDVADCFDALLTDLKSCNVETRQIQLPPVEAYNNVGWTTILAEAYHLHKERLDAPSASFGDSLTAQLFKGSRISLGDYIDAQHARLELTQALDEGLQETDILLLPVCTRPPCPVADTLNMKNLAESSLRMMCNVTGHPAIAMPIGRSLQGMPIGLQVVGKKDREQDLIRAALWIENNTSGWTAGQLPNLPAKDQTHEEHC